MAVLHGAETLSDELRCVGGTDLVFWGTCESWAGTHLANAFPCPEGMKSTATFLPTFFVGLFSTTYWAPDKCQSIGKKMSSYKVQRICGCHRGNKSVPSTSEYRPRWFLGGDQEELRSVLLCFPWNQMVGQLYLERSVPQASLHSQTDNFQNVFIFICFYDNPSNLIFFK